MKKYFMLGTLIVLISSCSAQIDTKKANTTETNTIKTTQQERLDKREMLPLNEMQREHVLNEMRGLLLATQGIIEGLANEDMQAVAVAASAVGMQARHTVENQANMKKLKMRQSVPPEFMKLGRSVHIAMDEIAQMAKDGRPAKEIQLKLANTMNACTACHSAYQIPNP